MAKDRPDFVHVRLTERGQQLAGDGPLRLSNGRRTFVFTGTEPLEVERSYEWRAVLSRRTDHQGVALFELVPDEQEVPA